MKKNLLELCLSPDLGGLELYMVRCAKALRHDFNVISVINPKGKLEQYFLESLFKYERLHKRSNIFMFQAAKKLAQIIDTHHIDILHLHWTKDIPIAVLAKKLSTCKPKLVQTRNMTMTRFKDDFYHRFLYKNIDMMLPVTHQVADQLQRFIPKQVLPRVEVLYMGSDTPELLSEKEKHNLAQQLDMNDHFRLGMVGRIEEGKGQHLLIEAVAHLRHKGLHVEAFFVGHEMSEGYIETLKARAKALHVGDKVHFLGFMKNPHHFYQLCDTVVLATPCETFGLVVIEAMQVGTAVIATNRCGPLEIIDHGENGMLFEANDAASLAKQIVTLYRDEPLRQKIADAGFKKCDTHFSNTQQFEKLTVLLNEF